MEFGVPSLANMSILYTKTAFVCFFDWFSLAVAAANAVLRVRPKQRRLQLSQQDQ
jgi:hypothetical protein